GSIYNWVIFSLPHYHTLSLPPITSPFSFSHPLSLFPRSIKTDSYPPSSPTSEAPSSSPTPDP
ncbi:unnamed protein product, partial [Prunus brigantina]